MILRVKRQKKNVAYCQLLQTNVGDLEISYIHVDPEYRGQGIATQMLKRAQELAKRQQVDLVAFVDPDGTGLTVDEENDWLKRHGFKHRRSYDLSPNRPRTFLQSIRHRPNNKRVMIYEVTI